MRDNLRHFDVDDPLDRLERDERNVRLAFGWVFAICGTLLFLMLVWRQ